MTENKTIATIPAKALKELHRWNASGRDGELKPSLKSVFYQNGYMCATDSYRAARVWVGEHDELKGAVLDLETFDRMTARDSVVILESDGARIGKAFIPYDVDLKPIGTFSRIFKGNDERDDAMTITPAYLDDLTKLAKSVKDARLEIGIRGQKLVATIEANGFKAEALVMGIRR